MTKVQKWEIGTSLSATIILLLYLCLMIWYFGFINEVTGYVHDGIVWLSVPLFLSLLVATAALFDALTRNTFAKVLLWLVGSAQIIFLVLVELIVGIWGLMSVLGLLFALLVLTPAILTTITLILALTNKKHLMTTHLR
ncbi:MAG TPA: hypothetical protein VIL74_17040 [Pyrinomonadaceae bacterium]|jgi:hypothetical protein